MPAEYTPLAVAGGPAVYRVAGRRDLQAGIRLSSPVAAVVRAPLAVRGAPSDAATVVARLHPGATIKVVERRGEWLQIDSASDVIAGAIMLLSLSPCVLHAHIRRSDMAL